MSKNKIIALSPPEYLEGESEILIQLFELGLERFHLRKPNFSDLDFAHYLAAIPAEYWRRIVLHDHYHLAEQLGLGGVHLTEQSRKEKSEEKLLEWIADFRAEGMSISAAIHDLKDLEILGKCCDYVLVSPVFDSISKPDYLANTALDITEWKEKTTAKLFALGGVTAKNVALANAKGFDGVAVLGYIWKDTTLAFKHYERLSKAFVENVEIADNQSFEKEKKAQQASSILRKKETLQKRPHVLSLAGHDPSAGAGLTADLKTFEQQAVYGLSVCTALTIQNHDTFESVEWMKSDFISRQIAILKSAYPIKAIKIGLIENWSVLEQIIHEFRQIPIVFDPILRASAGFDFHADFDRKMLYKLLKNIQLITPNRVEILQLVPSKSAQEAAQFLSTFCPVLLKGGHHEARLGEDELWKNGKQIARLEAKQIAKSGKHGSGCVLSAAVVSALAKGEDLERACQSAKTYTEVFLNSNEGLLGYHS